MALRPARRRASARRSSRLGTMLAEEISQAVRVVEENIETFACHQPGGSSSSPKLQPSLTSFPSSGPREKPTFFEIWALKSLRKGWENKTEPVAVTKRIPIAEIDARDARSRRAVEVSAARACCKAPVQIIRRSDLLIGETILSFSRLFMSERHRCSRHPNSVLSSGQFCNRKKTRP